MYGFDENTKEGGSFLSTADVVANKGIFEDVLFRGAEFDKQANYEAISLEFEWMGKKFTHKEFPVDPEKVKQWDNSGKPEEAVKKAFQLKNSVLKHIAHAITEDDKVAIPAATSFEDLARKFNAIVNKHKGKGLRMLIQLNKKDYPSLPLFPRFIEPMSVEVSGLAVGKYNKIKPSPATNAGKPEEQESDFATQEISDEEEGF